MARGNDGNLLQHAVETFLATNLANAETGLYLICTHSMAPFEPIDQRGDEYRCGRFYKWWERGADGSQMDDEPAFLTAYRNCRALARMADVQPVADEPAFLTVYRSCREVARRLEKGLDLYPNTAQIISSLLGRDCTRGVLVELEKAHYDPLQEWCKDSYFRPWQSSWRKRADALRAPENLDRPWLFSMDPMKFWPHDNRDDDDLHPGDDERLIGPVKSFFESGQTGVFAGFCYGMSGPREFGDRKGFQDWARNLADRMEIQGLAVRFAEIRNLGHIGALISLDAALLDFACDRWETVSNA